MKNPKELLDVAAIIVHPQQTSEAYRVPTQTQDRKVTVLRPGKANKECWT